MVYVVMKKSVKVSELCLLSSRVLPCSWKWSLLALQKASVVSTHRQIFQLLFHSLLWKRKVWLLFSLILASPTAAEVGGEERHRRLFPPAFTKHLEPRKLLFAPEPAANSSDLHSRLLPAPSPGILYCPGRQKESACKYIISIPHLLL